MLQCRSDDGASEVNLGPSDPVILEKYGGVSVWKGKYNAKFSEDDAENKFNVIGDIEKGLSDNEKKILSNNRKLAILEKLRPWSSNVQTLRGA